jgi:hypothetical protein
MRAGDGYGFDSKVEVVLVSESKILSRCRGVAALFGRAAVPNSGTVGFGISKSAGIEPAWAG